MFDKNKFKAQMVLMGVTCRELACNLGINEATLYRKINNDGSFTRDEINKIIGILKIDDPEAIFFAKELAYPQVT